MSKIKVGINGFGRIGRITFRAILKRDDVEVLAINDLLDVNHLAYLLKYDSVHGKLDDEINVIGNDLVVNGNKIRVTAEKNPLDINWGDLEIDVVADVREYLQQWIKQLYILMLEQKKLRYQHLLKIFLCLLWVLIVNQ